MNEDNPTPLSQQAADPIDPTPAPKSWHGPVEALRTDMKTLRSEMTKIASDFTREVKSFNEKTDIQNVALGRIEALASKASSSPLWTMAKTAIYLALAGYVATHGASANVSIPKEPTHVVEPSK